MLHVFYGSDSFSVHEAFNALKEKLNTDGSLNTNTVTFYVPDATPAEVIAACDTIPFLGEYRLVVVDGALYVSGRGRRKAKASLTTGDQPEPVGAWSTLADYIERMPQTTELVLLGGEKADGALVNALRSRGDVQKFERPAQKAVSGWVQKRAKDAGIPLASGAAAALADLVGEDTWAIATELEKLRNYAAGRPVTVEDVREMVTPIREIPPWDLLDPIADGRGANALKALRRMLDHKPTLVIAAIIQGTYRQLAVAREMVDNGASGRDVGERLGLRGFPLDKLLERATRYRPEMIRDAYARMVQADSDIKTGVYDDDLSLELLVTDLAVAAALGTRAA